MTRILPALCVSAAVLAALFSSTTLAISQELRDLSIVQVQSYNAGSIATGDLSVMTLLDRADATYGLGETVRLAVKTNEDAYVTVLNIGASGKVTQLFPNAVQNDNRIKAGETVEIPSADSGSSIRVSGPVGAELIKVIATSKPVTVIPASRVNKDAALFFAIEGDAEAVNRDLEVVAANPPSDTKIAIANQVIKTVAKPVGNAATAGLLVVPTAGAAKPTFPLLLASDKTRYLSGETITIGVTPLQTCHLTVVARDGAGEVTLLYPNASSAAGPVAASKAVLVSGGSAPQTVIANGLGTHTVTALCRSQPRAASNDKAALDIPSDDEVEVLNRDLSVEINRPQNTTAFATITFDVSR